MLEMLPVAVRPRTVGRALRKGNEMDQERNLESTDDSGPRTGQGSWLPPSAPGQPNTLREIENQGGGKQKEKGKKRERRERRRQGREEGDDGRGRKTYVCTKGCARVAHRAFICNSPNWKHPKCPSPGECLDRPGRWYCGTLLCSKKGQRKLVPERTGTGRRIWGESPMVQTLQSSSLTLFSR